MTSISILFWPIFLPLAGALLVLATPRRVPYLREALALLAALGNLVLAGNLFGESVSCSFAWCAGLEFTLRLYRFSAFFLLAVAFFAFLVTLYCWRFMRDRNRPALFCAYLLISLAMANGIVLADHLVVLLFFWEGLLGTTFGMIALGSPEAFKTAIKAFIIVGITDLVMLFGIVLTGWQTSLVMHQARLPMDAMGCLAAAFLSIGAISKAGSLPFHTWIPDAAVDAPLPFMAFLPASLEKLLGIYLLARITLDLFPIEHTWLSPALMIVGSAGLLIAVMMALVQKNYKRLLSYHAISQVGYMILGLGTALPAGVIGGLFHMLNNALYKCGLFLTSGIGGEAGRHDGPVEARRAGLADAGDLRLLPGLRALHLRLSAVQRVLLEGTDLRCGEGAAHRVLSRRAPRDIPHRGVVPQTRPRGVFRQARSEPRFGPRGADLHARPDDRHRGLLHALRRVERAAGQSLRTDHAVGRARSVSPACSSTRCWPGWRCWRWRPRWSITCSARRRTAAGCTPWTTSATRPGCAAFMTAPRGDSSTRTTWE